MREPISAHRTIKKMATVPTDDPRAISRCSKVAIPRCYPLFRFLNLAKADLAALRVGRGG
jgi:hypothetical protein